MTDTILIEAVIGAVLPPIIDILNSMIENKKLRYVLSLLVCLGIGIVFNLNNLDATNVLASASIVFASAQTVYQTYWRTAEVRTFIVPKETLEARKDN